MVEDQSYVTRQNAASVLITGGSGLIGRYLTNALLARGYHVSHLSRKTGDPGRVRVFKWDPGKNIIDPSALDGTDYIIHLAGANIGEKRWTKKRKDEIRASRVDSARLLFKTYLENGGRLKAYISASATGYYGSLTSDRIFIEADDPAADFLGTTCRLWEESAGQFEKEGVRTVRIRTAVVLEKNDSALSKLMFPAKFGFLIQTGSGNQYMPWIGIKDLCSIYIKAIEDSEMKGAYNAVSPQHVTHKDFMNSLSLVMNRPLIPFPVPDFVLRAVLGEMADIVIKGSRVSSEKIKDSGYRFQFGNLTDALMDTIYGQAYYNH
jgi:uncharacterized protein